MIDEKKRNFWMDKKKNVLMVGRHGVGKTAMIEESFNKQYGEMNVDWKYFSAATMDPWVDFVGVPKEMTKEDGTKYLGILRPEGFDSDTVKAIFLDELNRAKPKTMNALMELIQFKRINGVKFNNLEVIWAAINPEDLDEEDVSYNVEKLDSALKDRFTVQIEIPYEPSREYFEGKYGESGEGAIEWWHDLEEAAQKAVSPRRLEEAVIMYLEDGDVRDIIPEKQKDISLNITQLIQRLSNGSIVIKLASLYDNADADETKNAFSNMNFTTDAVPHVVDNVEYIAAFSEFIPADILSKMVTDDKGSNAVSIIDNAPADIIGPILASITAANTVPRSMIQRISELAAARGLDLTSENAFRAAVDVGLSKVHTDQSSRYNSLHAVNQTYNEKATFDVFAKCLEFISRLIFHSQDSALVDNKKPVRQIGAHVVCRLDKSLRAIDSDVGVMELWEKMSKEGWFSTQDTNALTRIENHLKLYAAIITENEFNKL